MTGDRNAAERMRRYRARQRGEDIPLRKPGPAPDPVGVTVIVLPLANRAEYARLSAGTHAYYCSTCCGSARFVVGRYRVCSRCITRALYEPGGPIMDGRTKGA